MLTQKNTLSTSANTLQHTTTDYYVFPCGCSFPIVGPSPTKGALPCLDVDDDHFPENCPATWELIGKGDCRGIFQLESNLGKVFSRKLRPESGDHMGALGAILRPGCVSGDTNVATGMYVREGRNVNCRKVKLRELYTKYCRDHLYYEKKIVSLDEQTHLLFDNKIKNVVYTGDKDVYRPRIKLRKHYVKNDSFYHLECTLDHPLLTHNRGWVELKDLEEGERIAVLNRRKRVVKSNGEKTFQHICFYNYLYRCVFCDWQEGALDVNHLSGNRKTNNDPSNLCYMCPNHHRLYSEEKISKEEVIQARERWRVRNSAHVQWAAYLGKDYVGKKDTYDVSVTGPSHNFVAGNIIVHNCLDNRDEEGVSTTEHYCRRKNGEEEAKAYHPSLEPILAKNYYLSIYQEDLMRMGREIAGFNLVEVEKLRKSVGKKDQVVLAEVKKMFLEGTKKVGVVSEEQAEYIWQGIEASGRYAFCRAHAISYGLTGYDTAYIKAHFPHAFFYSWLKFAKDKADPLTEIHDLVNDARAHDVPVEPPDLRTMEPNFFTDGLRVVFGLTDIKGVGETQVPKLRSAIEQGEKLTGSKIGEMSWGTFLMTVAPHLSPSILEKLIKAGALRWTGVSRKRMAYELTVFNQLTEKEMNFATSLWLRSDRTPLPKILADVARPKKEGGGAATVKRIGAIKGLITALENPPHGLNDSPAEIAQWESQLLGIALTCSAVESCDTQSVNCSCKEFQAGRNGTLTLGVKIEDFREVKTKRGKDPGREMAFLTVSDASACLSDCVIFPDAWAEFKYLLRPGNTVLLRGEKDRLKGSFIVNKVWQMREVI